MSLGRILRQGLQSSGKRPTFTFNASEPSLIGTPLLMVHHKQLTIYFDTGIQKMKNFIPTLSSYPSSTRASL
jgi:hypothetical protein